MMGALFNGWSRDPALRRYGAALCVGLGLTALWFLSRDAHLWLHPEKEALCWPGTSSCAQWRVFSADTWWWIFLATAVASLLVARLFRRGRRWAWFALLGLSVLQCAIVLSDYRFRLNQHYMLAWLVAVFLFFPDRRRLLRWLFVAFYVWAGTLKLNADWLSGEALPSETFIGDGTLLRIALAYVVVFELVVIWGLLAKQGWIFWTAYFHFLGFTLFSFTQVGFFYPLLMLTTSSIFLLDRAFPREAPRRLWPSFAVLAVFSLLQLVPFAFPGDSALTGEGRLFALHMFDARVECRSVAEVQRQGQTIGFFDLRNELPIRTQCDPAMMLARARALCQAPGSEDLTFNVRLDSKRATADALVPLVAINDFCNNVPEYALFSRNRWIQVPE